MTITSPKSALNQTVNEIKSKYVFDQLEAFCIKQRTDYDKVLTKQQEIP